MAWDHKENFESISHILKSNLLNVKVQKGCFFFQLHNVSMDDCYLSVELNRSSIHVFLIFSFF